MCAPVTGGKRRLQAAHTSSEGLVPRARGRVASGAASVERITLALLPLGSNNFTVAVRSRPVPGRRVLVVGLLTPTFGPTDPERLTR